MTEMAEEIKIWGITPGVNVWLENEPDAESWLVQDLIAEDTIAVLDGIGSTGKSYLALQLAFCVAVGQKWLGILNCKQGKVMYINAEDPDRIAHARFRAIASNYDHKIVSQAAENITFVSLLSLPPMSPVLMDPNLRPTKTLTDISNFCRVWRPELVIFDPLSSFIATENSNEYASQMYIALQQALPGTTILFIHHNNKVAMNAKSDAETDDRAKARGASNWVEKAKTRLYVRGEELRIDKCNYCPDSQGKRVKIVFRNGMFHAAGKLETAVEEQPKKRGRKPAGKGVIYA